MEDTANAVVDAAFATNPQFAATTHLALGDVRCMTEEYLTKLATECEIDLVIGGSPCQDLTRMAGPERQGLKGEKSSLFWEYDRVLKIVRKARPSVAFVLENVYGMPERDRDIITKAMGVTPQRLRACEISACKRDRYFWSNLPARSLRILKDEDLVEFADCLSSVSTLAIVS